MARPTLLLLPGLPCDARLWAHQVAHLTDIANPVVADLTVADTMRGLAEAVLEYAPPGPLALAGLSMGGYCALEIMRLAPERVTRLALLDTSARADTDEARANRENLIAKVEADYNGVIEALLPKLLHPDHLEDATIAGTVRAMARAIGKDAYIRQQHAIMSRTDSRESLADIRCPTLVLCGREDAITPVAIHEELAAGIPGATLEIVEHSGHFTPLERPQAVTDALRRWHSA